MEKSEFKQVKGQLTDAIVSDFKSNLEKCLHIISLQPCLENGMTEAELFFLVNHSHLDFFNPEHASKMADKYNFLELMKASPEQLEGIVGKLLIPIENDPNFESQPKLVVASRYFFSKINGMIMGRNYTTRIEPHDEIYLKCVQALYPDFRELSSLNAQTYNIIQETAREKCRSKAKLKQIAKIGTKLGYGICLE